MPPIWFLTRWFCHFYDTLQIVAMGEEGDLNFSGNKFSWFCMLIEYCELLCSLYKAKKKNSVSQSYRPHLFFCAHLILQNSDFHFFSWNFFFFIFTTKNEESLLFWKNLSTWELKKCVKSLLIFETTEVETFQSFLVLDVRGGKGQLK